MSDHLKDMTIRTGVVRRLDTGYLLECDPAREETDPHVKIATWHEGRFSESWANFNAHSACWVVDPEEALGYLALDGRYGIQADRTISGNILSASQPKLRGPRYGTFRSVSEVRGRAYAVGLRGMAYRLDVLTTWTRIDDGLAPTFNAQALHGFDASDLYAAGTRGELWHFNGGKWTQRDLPTNVNLTSVRCASDDMVYLAGHDGTLVRGREDQWEIIDQDDMTDDVWDLEWFGGELYVSTFSGVYRLKGEILEPVDFGGDPPRSTHHLSTAKGVLWSIGEFDVMSFDGTRWTRVV